MQYLNILKYIARLNLVVSIWFVSGFCSLYFRYDGIIIFTTYLKIIPSTLLLTVVYLFVTSLDRKLFGHAKKTTYEELFSVLRRYSFTGFLYFIFLIIYPNFILPKSFPILTTILALGLHLISRKVLSFILQRTIVRSNKIPVALYGAGTQTVSILNKI